MVMEMTPSAIGLGSKPAVTIDVVRRIAHQASRAQPTREIIKQAPRRVIEPQGGNRGGIILHISKKNVFTSIPTGVMNMASWKLGRLGDTANSPIAAGTMVEGSVPISPPFRPPKRSIATVTAVAIAAANNAGRIQLYTNNLPLPE